MKTWAETSKVVEFMTPIRRKHGLRQVSLSYSEVSHFPGLLILLRQTHVRKRCTLSSTEEQADAGSLGFTEPWQAPVGTKSNHLILLTNMQFGPLKQLSSAPHGINWGSSKSRPEYGN